MIGSREFGGGFVRLAFTANGERVRSGAHLSADAIKALKNHRRLIETGHIAVYPPPADHLEGQRHIVHRGGGAYDVIAGARLNAEPLTKEAAEALARGN